VVFPHVSFINRIDFSRRLFLPEQAMPNSNEPNSVVPQQSIQPKEELEALLTKRTEELRLAMEDLKRFQDVVVEAFGNALGAKHAESELHSKRVCAFAIVLSRAMGLHASDIQEIARGAFLHDIGKLSIPDEILTKAGKLTESEADVMRQHPMRGYWLLREIPFLSTAAEIVCTHHEWWDGQGYPNGLKGKSIPIGARIVAVAETFDCITSEMPYRSARSFASACEELHRSSGTQFEPQIVEAALRIPEELWSELRDEISGKPRMPIG
jgi:HD-GYP domain-containing protein (c-di-GMP phosphodiesterase class II)